MNKKFKNKLSGTLDLNEAMKELKEYANKVIKEELKKLPPEEREKALKNLENHLTIENTKKEKETP